MRAIANSRKIRNLLVLHFDVRKVGSKVTQGILSRLRGIAKSSVAIDDMENSLTQKICNGVSQP